MKRQETRVRVTAARPMASALLLTVLGAGCDGSADIVYDQPPSGSVTLVSYQAQTDGTMKSVSQVIPVAEFRALQDARLTRQKQRQAGIEVRQEPLTYLGRVGGVVACNDDRTTWLYDAEDGWTLPPHVYISCFGAGPGGDWTGSVDLRQALLPNGRAWSDAVRSMWVSGTYRAGLQGAFSVIYNTWDRVFSGYPNARLWHQL